MAPIKFEEKLKDKLENRTLQPSSDAWNTLAERLDIADKKNNNVRFWWIGIAASLLGVILVTTQFYKKASTDKNLPIVFDNESIIETKVNSPSEPVTLDEAVLTVEKEKQKIEVINSTKVASIANKTTSQKPVQKENAIIQFEKTQDVIAKTETNAMNEKANNSVKVLTQEELKVIQVVDVIKQLQANESSVSEREIDSLLKQAQREILKQNIYNETTKTVDANALLQDVEVELEKTFRDKVFEALKSGYGSVKTAVAERRN